ncbi:hypothetical protein ADUPG1_012331 [Aduncisulcus paluster]|uniref:SAM domain-containing protein n=1 Tax=Aduncisulcus paluster TaxID=2918883 RepID=A0ABQ5K3A3_9EUKA|nr:hypothetical protein ADUPG1_012331 [Aduncisulcus paluster]
MNEQAQVLCAARMWTEDDVSVWLECIKYSQYIQIFKDNNISGKELLYCTEDDLLDMGIDSFGDRKGIVWEITHLLDWTGILFRKRLSIMIDEKEKKKLEIEVLCSIDPSKMLCFQTVSIYTMGVVKIPFHHPFSIKYFFSTEAPRAKYAGKSLLITEKPVSSEIVFDFDAYRSNPISTFFSSSTVATSEAETFSVRIKYDERNSSIIKSPFPISTVKLSEFQFEAEEG